MERAELTAALQPLADTLDDLAMAVHDVGVEVAARDAATKKRLEDRAEEGKEAEKRQVRRTRWIGLGVILLLLSVAAVVDLGQSIRSEGEAGRQNLKCVVAVLFRQDPPACPGAKEDLIREGILPQGWPNTTTTVRP
jgi:hypothetical protein